MPHTPGPWTWTEGWGSSDIINGVLGPDRQVVVDPIDGDGDPAFICKPEDIRLIAAAPEMYELLRDMEFHVMCHDRWEPMCPCCRGIASVGHDKDCRYDRVLTAILKAVKGSENA